MHCGVALSLKGSSPLAIGSGLSLPHLGSSTRPSGPMHSLKNQYCPRARATARTSAAPAGSATAAAAALSAWLAPPWHSALGGGPIGGVCAQGSEKVGGGDAQATGSKVRTHLCVKEGGKGGRQRHGRCLIHQVRSHGRSAKVVGVFVVRAKASPAKEGTSSARAPGALRRGEARVEALLHAINHKEREDKVGPGGRGNACQVRGHALPLAAAKEDGRGIPAQRVLAQDGIGCSSVEEMEVMLELPGEISLHGTSSGAAQKLKRGGGKSDLTPAGGGGDTPSLLSRPRRLVTAPLLLACACV